MGVKITFYSLLWSLRGAHFILSAKIREFDPKIVKNIFEIICIFMAAKNHISNFADNSFCPEKYITKLRIFDSVRDDLGRYTLIGVKRGVYKVTDMVFRCHEDANNFKNIFNHFGLKIVILTKKLV